MKKSACSICGYQWLTGQNGSHQCSTELLSKIEDTAKALQKIKDIVVGESNPSFFSHIHTTRTRMEIADICDGALSRGVPALEETCFDCGVPIDFNATGTPLRPLLPFYTVWVKNKMKKCCPKCFDEKYYDKWMG